MAQRSTENLALLTDLYLKQNLISQVYSFVGLAENKSNFLDSTTLSIPKARIYSFSYVPGYIKTVVTDPNAWTERIYPSVSGYSIYLKKYPKVEDYVKDHLKSRRKAINRAVRRLETCFDIHYKMFRKDITEEQYHFLMGRLKSMIVKRFEQRGQKSENLSIWEKVLGTSLALMKQGKASIFVIYNADKPIEISFNYNYNSILFSYISSYDIDYAKFSLGQVEIYKQLEWCIQNGYERFEMGWGDMDYKRQWSNGKYQFYHHVLYPRYSFRGFVYACLKGNRSRIIAFLISKGVNNHWNKLKEKFKGELKKPMMTSNYQFEDTSISEMETFEKINLEQGTGPVTNQMINDFLFLTQEHSNDVTLHYSKIKDLYILKGKSKTKAVLINPVND